MLVSIPCNIEQTGLSAVGITHKCYENILALRFCYCMTEVTIISHNAWSSCLLLVPLFCFLLSYNLHHISFSTTQTHLIVHHFVFHRILQRSVQHHLYLSTLDEPHLNDAFPESSVTIHLGNHGRFSSFQFR